MRVIFYIIICILSLNRIQAQSGVPALQNYLERVRNGSHEAPPQFLNANGTALLEALQPFLSDSSEVVRARAYDLLSKVGQKSEVKNVREVVIESLARGIEDENSGISGSVTHALQGFKREDFTPAHKEAIGQLLVPGTFHLEEVVKLAGYLGHRAYISRFNSIVAMSGPFREKWAARLALARMGEQSAIDYIVNKISKVPVNDDFVYDIVPDLIYTRRPEVFEFLETVIHSEEANCLSADPDASDNILCGYRVMEYLAPVIEGYPLPVDEFGSLEVDNYRKALEDVRSWLRTNDYTIITETF